ncbi:DUF971 domain-containing protein [Mesorhizobium sp. BR1-1-16]|uniref:gamma-butyrobetaine hydroxylase-like domain-containing protein n=1 Tax=Mesorhizobium sp. BR1-1-16 TaxID=2876653 RepID=UPI001CC92DED|nr:DUF971 domain-containing protein [Mesorhizobium sp. BR1-1-16]MBZ9937904.1 DUF971 domain-containing protein [Mesorhizobium sp. BR1-1-16]
MTDTAPTPWPTELRLSPDKRHLSVAFDNGSAYTFSAEFLRVTSPSAEVQGHTPSQRQTVPGKIDVAIRSIDPVGNYAVRLNFDDGHHTGLFSWKYLAEIGRDHDELWARYLDEVAAKGLSRSR